MAAKGITSFLLRHPVPAVVGVLGVGLSALGYVQQGYELWRDGVAAWQLQLAGFLLFVGTIVTVLYRWDQERPDAHSAAVPEKKDGGPLALTSAPEPPPARPVKYAAIEKPSMTPRPTPPPSRTISPNALQPGSLPSLKPARPHISIVSVVVSDRPKTPSQPAQIRAVVTLRNETDSVIPECRVMVETVSRHGVVTDLNQPIMLGNDAHRRLERGAEAKIILLSRNYNAAPIERVRFNAAPIQNALAKLGGPGFELEDNTEYTVIIRVYSDTGVITRGTIALSTGEYEHLVVSLSDQSSWRQVP